MRMKALLGGAALLVTVSAAEEPFNLKINMLMLNAKVGEARESMIRNDKAGALDALKQLKTDVHDLLSNKEMIESLLPPEKKHKSYIAVEAARKIEDNIAIIEKAYTDDDSTLPLLKRQASAQRAYTSIEMACFHCHNLVRDQE